MRQQILNLFTTPRDMSWEDILLNIVLAAVLGFFIFLSYAISHRGTIYSRKFNASLVILAVLTGTVMTVIGNNIALSLGMVGALSIVRFRTAIKDSRDTVYIFWSIIVGICCGVGDYAVACIGSAVTFAVILLLGCIKSDNRMLLIIRAHRSKQEPDQGAGLQALSRQGDAACGKHDGGYGRADLRDHAKAPAPRGADNAGHSRQHLFAGKHRLCQSCHAERRGVELRNRKEGSGDEHEIQANGSCGLCAAAPPIRNKPVSRADR